MLSSFKTLSKDKLFKLSKLCGLTANFLKRSAGKKFRTLTIGETGSEFSKDIIEIIYTTDRHLRAIWDHFITHIFKSLVVKISKVQVKSPIKKIINHDPSLLVDFEILDAYAITEHDAEELMLEISGILGYLGASLKDVLKDQQKVAYLLGIKKAKISLTDINQKDLKELEKLQEDDLRILEKELAFQEKHLNKFMEKLENKYKDLLYTAPGEPLKAYGTQKELLNAVENVDTTSIHQLDMYALAAVEVAMMAGTEQTFKGEQVTGGIWHTMQDGGVCPDCAELNGNWMTWEEFHSIYKNTYCDGSCRCGELFEPCNNSTDPYSNTQGREYYYEPDKGMQPCISPPNFSILSMFKCTTFTKKQIGAQPGSTACLMVQNSEKAAQNFYNNLSPMKKRLADRFSVSPKLDYSKLDHLFTPSSAQFRTQLYRALDTIDDGVFGILETKYSKIYLTADDFATGASTFFDPVAGVLKITAKASPYTLKNDLLIQFGKTFYSTIGEENKLLFRNWMRSSQAKRFKQYFTHPGNKSDVLSFAKLFSQVSVGSIGADDLAYLKSILPFLGRGSLATSAQIKKSIIWYTGRGYEYMNEYLRTGYIPKSINAKEFLRHKDILIQHLELSSKYTGICHRGISFPDGDSFKAFIAKAKVGTVYSDKGFLSTSKSIRIASGFDRSFGNIRFSIRSKTGVDISKLSNSLREEEILFRPNTQFRIKAVFKQGDLTHIVMEEI